VTSTTLRVLIADDQALVRTGLRMILEAQADIAVVAEAADGEAAVRLARHHRPDVVLMDVRMPGMDGLTATRLLLDDTVRDAAWRPRVVILTTFELDEYVYAALKAGAAGFLLKDMAAERLVAGVRLASSGDALLAPSITRRLVERFAPGTNVGSPSTSQLGQLTARETDVLRLVAQGMSNLEIAGALVVGEATVKSHVATMLGKLGLRNRAQAVVFAYESGLVRVGSSRPIGDGDQSSRPDDMT
jgi:DNA-binding NarL/FixJ family response regulator